MSNKRILQIEDDLDFMNFVKSILETNGYDFYFIDSPEGAEEFIIQNKIDLIILDLNFFEHDDNGKLILKRGEDTLINRQFDPILKNIPVVVCTSENQGRTLLNVDSIGANDFLAKPTNAQTLLQKVKDNLKVT